MTPSSTPTPTNPPSSNDNSPPPSPDTPPPACSDTDAPLDVQQVLLAVERIVVPPRPRRRRTAYRLIVVERGLQPALSACEAGQLTLQVMDPSGRDQTLHNVRRAAPGRVERRGVQLAQHRHNRPERIGR